MAGSRAGLRKVQKTVRTKKGTARRSYWVKGSQTPKKGRSTKQGNAGRGAEHTHAKRLYTGGMIAAGMNAGGLVQAYARNKNRPIDGRDLFHQAASMAGGALGGYAIARLTRNRMSTRNLQLGGAVSGLGGSAMGLAAMHRQMQSPIWTTTPQRRRR